MRIALFKGIIANSKPMMPIELQELVVKGGIYSFGSTSDFPVLLRLQEVRTLKSYELVCESKAAHFAKLQSGKYRISIAACSKQQQIDSATLIFERANLLKSAAMLIRKIKGDRLILLSPNRLLKAARTLLQSKSGTVFKRHSANAMLGEVPIGPISRYEISNSLKKSQLAHLVEKYRNRILLQINGKTIRPSENANYVGKNEINESFSLEYSKLIEYVLNISVDDSLLPDAFLQVALAIESNLGAKHIVLDTVSRNFVSGFPAFDPLLFDSLTYRIPILSKIDSSNIDFANLFNLRWFEIENNFAKYNSPVTINKNEWLSSKINCETRKSFVSIIIPTRDKLDLLRRCVNSILANTYRDFEIIIINNRSVREETLRYFSEIANESLITIDADIEFNFSKLCNLGAKQAKGEVLVFLNNDIVIDTENWLDEIAVLAVNPNIGCVGASLWYENDTLQHGGIFLNVASPCGHILNGLAKEKRSSFPNMAYNSLRSAVTGAMIGIEKSKFEEVSGFDEIYFGITYNDVDLCLKLLDRNYYNCIANNLNIYHSESASRASDSHHTQVKRREKETEIFINKWRHLLTADKWLSPYVDQNAIIPSMR